MQTQSVHDNRIIAYEVDAERRRIILHTRFDDRTPTEYTDVIFDGVLGYRFENDNFGNIILDIEEISLSQLLSDNRNVFEGGKKYGWPGVWNESPEASMHYFESNRAKAFEISSSFGMDGWVIAESYRLERVRHNELSNTPLGGISETTECVLRAYGQAFDVDRFLADSPWRPNPVYRRGEKEVRSRGFEPHECSGFVLAIDGSNTFGEPLTNQTAVILKFLEENRSECERLKRFPGIEGRVLDFAVYLLDDQPIRSHHIPVELVRAAADIDVALEITVYAVSAEAE